MNPAMGPNIFEENFRLVNESSKKDEEARKKLIGGKYDKFLYIYVALLYIPESQIINFHHLNRHLGIIELNDAKKACCRKHKELVGVEAEIAVCKTKNRDMKIQMIRALVERDELLSRQRAIESNIERLSNQIANMHREMDDLLRGDEVDSICERFAISDQVSLLEKIQDNRSKLLKNGCPLHLFA